MAQVIVFALLISWAFFNLPVDKAVRGTVGLLVFLTISTVFRYWLVGYISNVGLK